jgi:pSer/pThr/pTyr-binding forkhead associated (FHA) protein
MGDARLNSIHLPDPRRMLYRHAREVLLQSRGPQTIWAAVELPGDSRGQTLIESPDAEPSGANYWLADEERVYPLKVGVNTVGRAGDNDVVVEDGCVSRRHCAILVHVANCCELHDTASKNGTYLNGTRLAGPARLRPGDEIRMCGQHFVFQARPEAPLGPPGNEPTLSH